MGNDKLSEPWLRGTLTDVYPVQRAVLHALELASEDLRLWCGGLSDEQLNARPGGVEPLSFHLRHIGRSLDRLLTYAEGRSLNQQQINELKTELDAAAGTHAVLFAELDAALTRSSERVRAFTPAQLGDPRKIGRKDLPTTVAGILVHIADHTQRHVGQAITSSKIVMASPAVSGAARVG